MGKRKSDRPFCDGCPNLDEGMSFSADEEEARNCDVCEEKTKEEERGKEEVQFT